MKADYVIIGSGSAGSAMAYRLSEDGKYSVLVLEYGGTDFGPFIQMPAALSYPMNMSRYDWGFKSEPEPNLGGRRLVTPRGKVIGGSSSINGMVYVRGHPMDFDHWEESGAASWGFRHVLPYFKRMEHWHDGGHGGDPAWRGSDGPLHVTRGKRDNPLFHAFVEAGRQAGFELTADYNGEKQEGFGPMEQTVWQGRRWSAANAYLRPALKRPNCHLISCFVRRIVIENGRAIGVEIDRGGRISIVSANREVILAASSINSPKILMLSGIGPAAHLAGHGIDVVANRPGVGRESAGSSGTLYPAGVDPADHALQVLEFVEQGADRRAMATDGDRPRRVQSVRIRRLFALAARCTLPRYSIPLPADRRAL